MRATLITPVLCCIAFCANAQLTLSAKGGFNHSYQYYPNHGQGIYVVDDKGNTGWQAGLMLEKVKGHLYIYGGMQLNQNNFQLHYYTFNVNVDATYKPLYLVIPAGMGYQISAGKPFSARFFGGIYTTTGIGGSLKKAETICGDERACTELPPPIYSNNKLSYNSNSELNKVNFGFQLGAGVNMFKSLGLSLLYNRNLQNTCSKGMGSKMYLSSLALDAQVKLASLKPRSIQPPVQGVFHY